MPIFFTPKQANDLLLVIFPIVTEIVARKKEADRARIPALEAATGRIQDLVARLEELGVVLKDADMGLVDFPAVRLGRRVYLCWKLGEPEVAFWHGLEEGYAGRKRVESREFYDEDTAFQSLDKYQSVDSK